MTDSRGYGDIFADMIDIQAKYHDRGELFRLLDISRNQFYNVTNPNRTTSGGNSYSFPLEWMVRFTREFKDYSLVRAVAKDCGGIFISFSEIEDLENADAPKVLEALSSIVGKAVKRDAK